MHYEHVHNKTGRNVGETPTALKKLLLVDDEPDITLSLGKRLEHYSYYLRHVIVKGVTVGYLLNYCLLITTNNALGSGSSVP